MRGVYIETSFFSACVSTRKDDKFIGWRASSIDWWMRRSSAYNLFISAEVARELSAPEFSNGPEAIKMLSGLEWLDLTSEVQVLADLFVTEKVLPAPATAGDAIHVAAATVHRVEHMLTWNVRHLANPNKRTHLAVICMRLGLVSPQIVTPDML